MNTSRVMASTVNKINASGRPPKFREDRRPVTVTLPERILRKLEAINADRAHAIVKCVEAVAGNDNDSKKMVEQIEVLPGKALIVVGPSKLLRTISWLRLVEITPARYLLVLPSGVGAENLEVALFDLLENMAPGDAAERPLLDELRSILINQRRNKSITKAELIFVNIG